MPSRIITLAAALAVLGLFDSLRAQPTALTRVVYPLEYTEVVVPEPIDLPTVLAEDQLRESLPGPYPFAVPRLVHVTPETNGLWEEIDNETLLWRLPIASPGALSLSLGFTRYFMPEGSRMYIYSVDESQAIGPFTEQDNKEHGQLWTPIINSDAIVVELTIPVAKIPDLELELSYINHGYRGLNSFSLFGIGDAGNCHVNVACREGDPWRNQIRSVARYDVFFEYGPNDRRIGFCSGALINNTAQNNKPYFLTAFHCFNTDDDTTLNASEREATKTMVMYWNFQAKECRGSNDFDAQYQSGATFRAGYWKSDFALVELEDMPPTAAKVYYAGWSHDNAVPSSGVAIHHPREDLKKISIANDGLYLLPTIVNHGDETNPIPIDHGDCFQVHGWDVGITEKGSSGGPLFDLNSKRVIGQALSGACTCDTQCVSSFGPFYRSWNESQTRDTRLSDWLDPGNTGVTFLDGKNGVDQTCDTITIGIGTEYSGEIFPLAAEYEDGRTQIIYLADEIGQKGSIRGLALYITTVPGQRMNNWTIRMKHTTKSQYSTCTFETTGWTVMYQRNESVGSTGWHWFTLQTPFEYNGSSNLMVDFSFNNSSSTRSGECRWSSSAGKRSVIARSNSENGDPLDWAVTMQDCVEAVPIVQLDICGSVTAPATPTLSSPANGATGMSLTPTLRASAFSDSDGDTHANSQWQVDNNSGFTSPEWDSGQSYVASTQATVPSGRLSSGTTYYWRVRYKDNRGSWSNWSSFRSFTTTPSLNRAPATPALSSPANGATGVSLTPTLRASAFSDPDGDSHANSQWQVDNNSGFTSLEWDSGQSYTASTQATVPSGRLSSSTTYYWRARYKDNRGAWSTWSSFRSFTTLNNAPATPTLLSPANGATMVSLTPTLRASVFSDPDGDTHANSQWQVDNNSGFSGFTSPEWDSGQSYAASTQATVPSGRLNSSTTYYWRVRYKDNRGSWSSWSLSRSFTTLNNVLPPVPSSVREYPSSDVPKDIWDNMSIFSTLVIVDTGTIADIDVRLNITHTYCEDLSVYLRPPPGLGVYRIKLFSSIGNSHNNFSNTILDDEAPKAITQGAAPFTGSYRPVGRLSTLYGRSMTGTWKLEVSDEARWDQGMLNSWSLIIKK